MAEFPALPLFTDAYLGDTTHLTTIEHGAYLLLLMVAWRSRDCALPDDDRLLARYAKCTGSQWRRLRPIIEPFFVSESGQWKQRRLTDEFNHVRQVRESQRANGQASALKRKGRHSTTVEPSVNEASTPSPTPTPIVSEAAKATSLRDAFPRPEWADVQVWSDFMKNRKKKRATNTETAYKGFLEDIERLSDDEWPPPRLLKHAAIKGWAGVYDPREKENGNGHMGRHQSANGISATVSAAIDVFGLPDASDERRVPQRADQVPRLGGPGGHG